MNSNSTSDRPVWAEVDLKAVTGNLRQIRERVQPQTKIMAVVKADGYGHGALQIAKTALANGADYLAVAILDEALTLRQAGINAPILILGYTPPAQAPLLVQNRITQTVYTLEMAQAISAAAVAVGTNGLVHLKIDTGMGRIGVLPHEAANFAVQVAQLPGIDLEGAFTHMSSADEDETYTVRQFQHFQAALAEVEQRGISIRLKHVANSATILSHPEMHLDMVRAGIILYGLWPSVDMPKTIDLKPAMQLKAKVAHVKTVPPGTFISYGRRFTTKATSIIATLPIGYADGWSRLLSNKAEVLLHGRKAPIVGRVCMDQCMVDVTDIPGVGPGDEAVLFGWQDEHFLPVDEVAAHMGTINYEIVCLISNRVPRVYIQ